MLVAIAGDEPLHAVMNRKDKQGAYLKYGPVHRPFSLADAREHLRGESTRAARLLRADGQTRALCFDADNENDWQRLRLAARLLVGAGYAVLVEDSPVGRGGHLWVIYNDLVDARCALRHVREIAPELAEIHEFWPGRKQNVRLPGGVYVADEHDEKRADGTLKHVKAVREQCRLFDEIGGQVAGNREEAAVALLAYQTPAAIVPDYPPDPEPEPKKPANSPAPKVVASLAGEVQFTTGQLAQWFNARHDLASIHPLETATHARAIWRSEKGRPSVSYLAGGRWYDHGQADQKSGDALDLYVLVSGRDKAEVLRELAREYRAELLGGATC